MSSVEGRLFLASVSTRSDPMFFYLEVDLNTKRHRALHIEHFVCTTEVDDSTRKAPPLMMRQAGAGVVATMPMHAGVRVHGSPYAVVECVRAHSF